MITSSKCRPWNSAGRFRETLVFNYLYDPPVGRGRKFDVRNRILSGSDLPVEAEAANRPDNAPSVDEEVRRRGRHPTAPPAFPRVEALLRHAFIEQGLRRGAGPGLDRTREHSIDHGVRQGDERQKGRYGAAAQGDVEMTRSRA